MPHISKYRNIVLQNINTDDKLSHFISQGLHVDKYIDTT